jgi:hypothetical protein
MTWTEVVLETSVIFNQLTRLTDREDFIRFISRQSFKYYIKTRRAVSEEANTLTVATSPADILLAARFE